MHGKRTRTKTRRHPRRDSLYGGRVRTRGSLKRALTSYRRRRKMSHCRGKRPASCRGKIGCKYAVGRKRSFCRLSRSRRRRR